MGEEGKVGKGIGKGEGGLDLDTCPRPPEFLVMPLSFSPPSLAGLAGYEF